MSLRSLIHKHIPVNTGPVASFQRTSRGPGAHLFWLNAGSAPIAMAWVSVRVGGHKPGQASQRNARPVAVGGVPAGKARQAVWQKHWWLQGRWKQSPQLA
eukprot:g34064.t1